MRNEFDLSVDEGTFDDYETFGVYSEDAPEGAVPEYEIFIVSVAQEIRRGSCRRNDGCPVRF